MKRTLWFVIVAAFMELGFYAARALTGHHVNPLLCIAPVMALVFGLYAVRKKG